MPVPTFTVVVSSCDAFSDTWEPFFRLYAANVSSLGGEILLITERAEFTYPNLSIRCTRANRAVERRLSWSECVLDALDQVRTDIILYFQDDYFIEELADVQLLTRLAGEMANNDAIKHIGLTRFSTPGPFEPTDDTALWRIGPHAPYRISLQAAFWRVDCLRSYLRPEENAWMLEIFGTRRSWRKDEEFLIVNQDRPTPLIYTHTGIIKGRWHRAMPDLFRRYDVKVDFHLRGFYDAPHPLIRKWRTFRTLLASPQRLWRGLRGL